MKTARRRQLLGNNAIGGCRPAADADAVEWHRLSLVQSHITHTLLNAT